MKKFIAAALAALMLSSFAGCANTAEEPKNETYIYGQVDSVSGNDIVLLLAEYNGEDTSGEVADSSEDGEGGNESDDSGSEKSERSGRPGSGEKPEGFTRPENGEMPEGFDPSKFGGEMPERSSKREKSSGESTESGEKAESGEKSKSGEKSGDGDTSDSSSKREKRERPEGFTKPENGEMPEGFDPSKFGGEMPEGFTKPESGEKPEGSGSKRSSKSGGSSSKFTLTGEQEELRIPVGTTVTTSLGVETDFKVIEAGNMIRCSVEKNSDGEDVITAVMIMEN